jgi:hypothetical protein
LDKKEKPMVGIAKKVKQVLNLVRKYSPYVDSLIPGFSTVVNTASNVGETIMDGAMNVYDDYKASKKKGKKYGLGDGVSSFFRPSGAVNTLTKDYGDVNPRLKLGRGKEEFIDNTSAAEPY